MSTPVCIFMFCFTKGLTLVNIGATDIETGNLKIILVAHEHTLYIPTDIQTGIHIRTTYIHTYYIHDYMHTVTLQQCVFLWCVRGCVVYGGESQWVNPGHTCDREP